MIKRMGAMRKNSKEAGNCKRCYYHKQQKAGDMDETLILDDCLYLHKPVNEATLHCKGNWNIEY